MKRYERAVVTWMPKSQGFHHSQCLFNFSSKFRSQLKSMTYPCVVCSLLYRIAVELHNNKYLETKNTTIYCLTQFQWDTIQHIKFPFARVSVQIVIHFRFCELWVLKNRIGWIQTTLKFIHLTEQQKKFASENEKYSSFRNNSTEFHFIKFKRIIILFFRPFCESTQFDNVMFFGCCNESFIHSFTQWVTQLSSAI